MQTAKYSFRIPLLIGLIILLGTCKSQENKATVSAPGSDPPGNQQGVVGGPFENGDFFYIGMPDIIHPVDTSPGWTQDGQHLLITGTMYQRDGRTPAPGVILYYYHTDIHGYYSNRDGLDPTVVRHGYIRGWVKSDENGKYSIYTVRPAPYPNEDLPAHIHPAIKEPGIDKEYYIDEFVFDDDPLLTTAKRKALENRGGSGILRVLNSGNLQIAEHNIILGLNIPNYPEPVTSGVSSGLEIGEDNPSFIPYHAFGPDKGSRACPVCKYGRYHGVMYFVGNHPDWEDIIKWLVFLDEESGRRSTYLKAYFVYGNENAYSRIGRENELDNMGRQLRLKNIALTYVPSMADKESEVYLNRINPEVENTFVVFKHRTIVDKFINFTATPEHFNQLSRVLDMTQGNYFDLPEPKHN